MGALRLALERLDEAVALSEEVGAERTRRTRCWNEATRSFRRVSGTGVWRSCARRVSCSKSSETTRCVPAGP